ncbi:MAG: hypothetical protein WCV68_02790 [Candidatus Paceibacterota bacterium]|jgi:hypothetical protein
MEGKIFDFSEFKKRKEETEAKKVEEKKPEDEGLSGIQGLMMDMVKQVTDAGGMEKTVSDAILAFQLEFSPNGEVIRKVRSFVKPQSTVYREAYGRADRLPLEEIRGQIEDATEALIKKHPTWYVVLMDNLKNRSKPK